MRYDISLKITHAYAHPASGGRHILHLLPAHIPGRQHRETGIIDVDPKQDERHDRFDFFDNAVSEIACHRDHDHLDFHMTARVENFAVIPGFDLSPGLNSLAADIKACHHLDAQSPHHFLVPSSRIQWGPEVADFVDRLDIRHHHCAAIIEKLGQAIHHHITFDADATTVDTPLHDALKAGRGVCQDYSHIMIACLRYLGIPAAYVSGFIRTIPPKGQPRLEGADAMHAWIRAWCGRETGWVEYDPTNALFVNEDHIIVAYGRDYDDVAPVKGVLKTFGDQQSRQAVDVVPLASAK